MNAKRCVQTTWIALALILALPALTACAADVIHHDGTFLSVTNGRFEMMGKDGVAKQTFPLGATVKVMRNGRVAKLEDLIRGDVVQINTETRQGSEYVVAVAAVMPE